MVTDGINVVYRKHTPCCGGETYAIVLHDGTAETVLAPARSEVALPGRDYAVSNGYTAFTRDDGAGAAGLGAVAVRGQVIYELRRTGWYQAVRRP